MALVLQLLLLLLSRAQGNPGASLDGHPGDRVNLSCVGVSQPTRWVWAPRFPACKGLSKGRRAILLASPSGTPTVSPVQPFAGRLRALDLDIRRLELLLSAGDSGTFICKGRQENQSRTELHVLGDRAYCRAPGPTHGPVYPQILIPLLGAGLVLGLGVLGWACWLRRRSPPHPPRPPPRFALSPPHSSTRESGAPEASRGGRVQDCRGPGPGAGKGLGSLLYADLDHMALRRSCRLSPVVPADASTTYAVVVRKAAFTTSQAGGSQLSITPLPFLALHLEKEGTMG
ncbi:megakaryocyte and platelet inhibitory receptor G6b isoform X1 [Physeter macrocephalus]|uniref:Megakaryocyte and platelet inhibitory receptor G6b isoform X1 n=1 Tax=Physeter macrocephalus TaxID=9755 RepID=A0A2Y9SGR2_PHYMC|nr:megakaryocyte and platelet inhibitory receptor G6b isoform X1 [Physeter catodon]|eukprot:XP_023977881.1 megakaryocyte and platelet inhibitory receptor G6b isoform X2 [Physeter catodon]